MTEPFDFEEARQIARSDLPWRTRLSLLWLKVRAARDWHLQDEYARVPLHGFNLLVQKDSLYIDTQSMRGMLVDEYFNAPMEGKVVIDVGAHKGYYSARTLLAGAAHVYSFEPEEGNHRALALTRSAAPEDLQRRWTVARCAIGPTDGEVVLNVSAESWSHSLLTPASGGTVSTQVVPMRRLAGALQQARGDHPGASLVVKINVEGAAGTMLLSTGPDDWTGVADLWCEFEANEPVDVARIEQHLAAAGLRRREHKRTRFRYSPRGSIPDVPDGGGAGRAPDGDAANLIPADEIAYHPQSFADPEMRLFFWRGEIYRSIGPKTAGMFRQLFRQGAIQRLAERGLLVETELTPFWLPGYDLVVRHRRLPFVSYPDEWCPPMFKDAALVTLDLAIALAEYGLTLTDAHPWNILFDLDAGGAVFVDWGSIVPIAEPSWQGYDEFCQFSLYPLIIMGRGHDRLARLLLAVDAIGVSRADLRGLLGGEPPPRRPARRNLTGRTIRFLQKRLRLLPGTWGRNLEARLGSDLAPADRRAHLDGLRLVRRQVEGVSLPQGKGPVPALPGPAAVPLHQWSPKQKAVHNLLAELRPATVLDIGTGSGWYAKLAAGSGSKVVALDIDPACLSRLYHDARAERLSIHPVVMDFTRPTPSRGIANGGGLAAAERLRCDVVLALGLLDQIAVGVAPFVAGKQFVNPDQFAEGLSLFTRQTAVVEFPDSDPTGQVRDQFIRALERRFSRVTVTRYESGPGMLLICRK